MATRKMFAAAQQANVVVHAIDPLGLEALQQAASAAGAGAGPGGQRVVQNLDSLSMADGSRPPPRIARPRHRKFSVVRFSGWAGGNYFGRVGSHSEPRGRRHPE